MAKKTETSLVTVKAVSHVFEAGAHFSPGDTFETTPDRAAALGDAVILTEAAAPV